MRNSSLRQRNTRNSAVVLGFEPPARTPQQQVALELQLASARLEVGEIYREFYEAAQMQRALSGPRMLRRGRFEITAEIFPVRNLSGDFFSISDRGASTLLAVGDICGKGLLAGMWFTHMLGLVRAYGESTPNPGAALKALNQHLCDATLKPPLASLFLAVLDYDRGELIYSNAGHPAPILLGSNGGLTLLSDGGPVLGAVPTAQFETGFIRLRAGDTLIQYTDGLVECRNDLGEEFGVDRLLSESRKALGASANEVLFSLVGAAQDFSGTRSREDDCTLMVIRCNALEVD